MHFWVKHNREEHCKNLQGQLKLANIYRFQKLLRSNRICKTKHPIASKKRNERKAVNTIPDYKNIILKTNKEKNHLQVASKTVNIE